MNTYFRNTGVIVPFVNANELKFQLTNKILIRIFERHGQED